MRRIVLAAALLALVAVGCKAEINVELQLAADGSGTLIAETGFDEEFEQFAFQDADPQEAIFEDNELADLPNAEFSTFEEGEFTFYRITVPFEDVNAVLAEAGAEAPFQSIDIDVTDDEVRVSAGTEEATDALFDADELEGFDPEILADTFAAHVRLKMPGAVTSHNADRVLDDGTLEWDIPLSGAGIDIEAASDPRAGESGGFPLAVLGGVAAAAAVAAVGGVVVMRRRNRGDETAGPPEVQAAEPAAEAAEPVAEVAGDRLIEATPEEPPLH